MVPATFQQELETSVEQVTFSGLVGDLQLPPPEIQYLDPQKHALNTETSGGMTGCLRMYFLFMARFPYHLDVPGS